jgi:ribosomal-protein-alanine N-acetyltransferase
MPIQKVFEAFPGIETKTLQLRRIMPSDSDELFKILSDPEVVEFYDDDVFTEVSQASDQITSWENGYKNRRIIRWGITKKEEKKLIGTCGFYGIHNWNKRASIGYELARSQWRHGIMTEALGAIVAFGFDEMELNRIDAVIMPGNVASIMMLEKIGFRQEGLLEEYEKWGNKGFVDLYMYAILRKSCG